MNNEQKMSKKMCKAYFKAVKKIKKSKVLTRFDRVEYLLTLMRKNNIISLTVDPEVMTRIILLLVDLEY